MASPPPNPYTTSRYLRTTFPLPSIAHVTINRPEKHNAFLEEMWLELPPLFSHLSRDPNIRAIILSGAGTTAFSTGLDVQANAQNPLLNPSASSSNNDSDETVPPSDPARRAFVLRSYIQQFQACLTALTQCSKPIIAAIHGYCLGLGVDLALCADVRICSASSKFSVKEVDIGLAADIGTLARLPKVVGNGSWVKDVCLSARVFGAEEARREGFVSWVGGEGVEGPVDRSQGNRTAVGGKGGEREKEEVIGKALKWAQLVAQKSPVAVQGTKELLNWCWDRSVDDGLKYTAAWNAGMVQTKDVMEAMESGMKGRRARFEKL